MRNEPARSLAFEVTHEKRSRAGAARGKSGSVPEQAVKSARPDKIGAEALSRAGT